MSRTVLFVHDVSATPATWDRFARRFTACGYECHAPAWPAGAPHDTNGQASLSRIVGAYAAAARALPEAPLLIGHGMGGLIVQLLLDRGIGAAGIAIAPFVSGGGWRGALALYRSLPPAAWFKRTATAQLLRRAAFGREAWIAFDNDQRAPLLLIAAENDRTIGAGAVAALFRHHRRSVAATAFTTFPGRSHALIAEPGWEAVADYGMEWFQQQSGRS
jgi:alpha-beta hydrolase superfamily lysophospholipase